MVDVAVFFYLPIYLSIPIYPSIYLPTCPSIYLSTDPSIYLSIYLFIYLSVCLSVCLSVYLSICKLENAASLRVFPFFWTWQRLKRSNFARHPQVLNLTMLKNEASLQDLFNFRSWQHQKRSNSARLRSKMESWVQSWRLRAIVFCDFSIPSVARLPRKREPRSYEALHLSRKIIVANLKICCA